MAIALGFDGARIETIEMGALHQPEDAGLKVFTDWLAGGHDLKPPTWNVLIQSLRAAKLMEVADLLDRTIDIVSMKCTVVLSDTLNLNIHGRKQRMLALIIPCLQRQ